jgi:hypothetical protein
MKITAKSKADLNNNVRVYVYSASLARAGDAMREYSEAAKDTTQEKEAINTSEKGEEREALLAAAKKLGIVMEGRSIGEIAQEISRVAEEREDPNGDR